MFQKGYLKVPEAIPASISGAFADEDFDDTWRSKRRLDERVSYGLQRQIAYAELAISTCKSCRIATKIVWGAALSIGNDAVFVEPLVHLHRFYFNGPL